MTLKDMIISGQIKVSGGTAPTGTIEISENGTYDVTDYASAEVNVGGPTQNVELKDVNFYDYEGDIVYSYSTNEFLSLTDFPAQPNHEGLVPKGWNWSFNGAKDYVSKFHVLDIGATYSTSDGATRIYLTIKDDINCAQQIRVKASAANDATIDWGDGTVDNIGTSYANMEHTYDAVGDYVISIKSDDATISFGGGTGVNIAGSSNGQTASRIMCIKKIIFGDHVNLETHVFSGLLALSVLNLPWDLTAITAYAYANIPNIKALIFPKGITAINLNNFLQGTPISKALLFGEADLSAEIEISKGWETTNLYRVTPPPRIKFIRGSQSGKINVAIIPDGVTTVSTDAYRESACVERVYIGKDVNYIYGTAFMSCHIMEMHLYPTTPPTLANQNAFYNSRQNGAKWYVPYSADHSILNAYKTADVWSVFADYFVEEPQ